MSRIICALLVMFLLCTACDNSQTSVNPEIIQPDNQKLPVEAFGIVKSTEIRDIFIPFSAAIDEICVKEGQKVKKGDTLAILDMKPYLDNISLKKNELKFIQEKTEDLKNEIAEITGSKAESNNPDIAKLENDLKFMEGEYQEILAQKAAKDALYESGAISKQEYSDFARLLKQKENDVENIRFSISSIRANLDEIREAKRDQLKEYTQQADTLEYEIRVMDNNLNKSYLDGNKVICNISNGLVEELNYNAGGMISTTVKLLSLTNLDTLVIEADVDEISIKDISVGDKVYIIPEFDKNIKLTGKVQSIAENAVLKNGETSIPLIISIDSNNECLKVNYNVEVKIFIV